MSEEILEKGSCVRCGKPSKNGGSGGRCPKCLKKLAAAKKTPGSAQRAQTKADDALRRQDGKNGTASHKSSGRGNRKDIVKQHQSAEKRTGQKLSPDRKDNGKGYAKGNTRSIPEKLNRGRHTADPKKLATWRKNLKKHNLTPMEMGTLLRAKAYESGDSAIIEIIEKGIGERLDSFINRSKIETKEVNKMSKSKIEELEVALSKAKEELSSKNASPQMASPDCPEEGREEVCEKCGHNDCGCTSKKKLKKSTEQLDEMIELLNKTK